MPWADDPRHPRAVLAANFGVADFVIPNDDEREIRYNVFQALQYLADWLAGNGCVALPAPRVARIIETQRFSIGTTAGGCAGSDNNQETKTQ